MKKQKAAEMILKLAEHSASLKVDNASAWLHYQPEETQKIKDSVKKLREK